MRCCGKGRVAAGIGGVVAALFAIVWRAVPAAADGQPVGDWPTLRQNQQLTGLQPMPGAMRTAPKPVARLSFGKGIGMLTPFASRAGGPVDRVLGIASGAARCYTPAGKLLWSTHPVGLNLDSLVTAEDLDGDGEAELAIMAGRPTQPLGAAVLLNASNGKLRWRYDVEPMSYDWKLLAGAYVPNMPNKQLVVVMHGYPPDPKNGYIVLFRFEAAGRAPKQLWRFDFDHYTCFPNIMQADVNGDGDLELCVETHSRMWVMEARTGRVLQYIKWEVAPATDRSYGLVRFQDLNGDGLPEFICIGDFSTHHEVLANEKGRFRLAWVHAWPESVTTRTIATNWPDPPIADIDGDGRLDMVVSMYKAEGEPSWAIRVYDAMTGVLKAVCPGRVAVQAVDMDGDGRAELLADITGDPNRREIAGACLLKWDGQGLKPVWSGPGARSVAPPAQSEQAAAKVRPDAHVATPDGRMRLTWGSGAVGVAPDPEKPAPGFDFSHIPADVGFFPAPPLVADMDGDGVNELIHDHNGKVAVYRLQGKAGFHKVAEYASDAAPAVADVDGDGRQELIIGSASASADTVVRALRLGPPDTVVWEARLPRPDRPGLPFGKPLYLQTGRFLGRAGQDVYVYVGTPVVRSLMLDGGTGRPVWEVDKLPKLERYMAPTKNLAAVWDVDGDGKDDLVFTCPDYYCVASGPTGALIVGPAFPPDTFKQASQGLYTRPVVLQRTGREAAVCLTSGHYFQAAMSSRAVAIWYKLPATGQAPSGSEGFLRRTDGSWLMGFGRQDGRFACVEVDTGKALWEAPIQATVSETASCDVDGDGRAEFVFGTSHGEVVCLRPGPRGPETVWRVRTGGWTGAPVIADIDGDRLPEIIVPVSDGTLTVLKGATGRPAQRSR